MIFCLQRKFYKLGNSQTKHTATFCGFEFELNTTDRFQDVRFYLNAFIEYVQNSCTSFVMNNKTANKVSGKCLDREIPFSIWQYMIHSRAHRK